MKAMFACLSGSPPAENGPIRTDYVAYNDVSARGCSSAGRALESHSRGQGFESPQLHRVMVSASSLIIRTSWSVITVGFVASPFVLPAYGSFWPRAYAAVIRHTTTGSTAQIGRTQMVFRAYILKMTRGTQ